MVGWVLVCAWVAVAVTYGWGRRGAGGVPLMDGASVRRVTVLVPAAAAAVAVGQTVLRHAGLPAGLAAGGAVLGAVALVAWCGRCSVDGGIETRLRRGARVACAPPRAAEAATAGELQVGGVRIPPADEPKHFKFIGTTGTGKSTAIHALLAGALARGDRAVIADPDGGYLARTYRADRGDLVLNPFDPRSVVWQPFRELHEPHDARELARALIGSASGESAAWHGYAETLLAALLQQLSPLPEPRVAELYRLLSSAPLTELRAVLDGTPAAPLVESGNERMFGSVRAIAMSRLAALPVILRQRGVHASVREWVREGTGVLYLPYRADQIATLRHLVSAWMRLAIFETMALGESDRRLWFVVDELDALGAIDGLKDALARLRKFGGRCVLGFQSIAQVGGTYGEAEARTIVENCATTLILRCSSSDGGGTARFAAQLIGQREVERVHETRSRTDGSRRESVSRSRQVALELAVLPAEIEALPDLEGWLKRASEPAWQRVRLSPPVAVDATAPLARGPR